MSGISWLSYEEVNKNCSPEVFDFDNTGEIEPLEGLIGHNRAVEAMEFGLGIRTRGYNIYMSGMTGTGKMSYAQSLIKKLARGCKTPDDWCYIYNFDDPNKPLAVRLPAGTGKVFQKDMEEFVRILKLEISKAFDSEDYEKEKAEIIKEFQEQRNSLIQKLESDASEQGFKVKSTNAGIYFLPVLEGKTISEQEFGELEDSLRHAINARSEELQIQTIEIIRKIKNVERSAENKIFEWENKIALFAVGMHINDLKEKYKEYSRIKEYLEKVQEDILDNLSDFRNEDARVEQQMPVFPWLKKNTDNAADKYSVNLFVDNSKLQGAPVIVDHNPTYYNLIGRIEYENEFGTMTTDFTMIKCGLLHQANGGYLILRAKDILTNVQSYEALKRVLNTKEICIENLKEQLGLVTVSTLKPEPVPLEIKVVLVGTSHLYQLLYEYDDDFRKLFKIKADFDDEIDKNRENIFRMAQFVSSYCRKENLTHFHRTGVATLINYSSWLVEDNTKLTTRFGEITDLISEACAHAQMENSGLVMGSHVKKAIKMKKHRSDRYDRKLQDLLTDGTILIDTSGEVVGQVNGLTVLDMGDYSFGKPARITAATYIGENGIVNIEREIEMSGTSHSKGVMILSGYIGQKFAQKMPLSLTASLCFEQLYSGVDGDSASSAELYAILSSLSDIPVKQYIAVTGSVNQKGEIQPIGGASTKIEGFFELCRARGLDGRHGVLIPFQNSKNLVLSEEVLEAVSENKFHIYAIKNIDEGIEVLTGIKAGEKGEDGLFPENTVNGKVFEKLGRYAETVSQQSRA